MRIQVNGLSGIGGGRVTGYSDADLYTLSYTHYHRAVLLEILPLHFHGVSFF